GLKEPMAMEDPAEFVAQLFRMLLEKRGIVVRGKTLARHGEGAQFFAPPKPVTDNSSAGQSAIPSQTDATAATNSQSAAPQPTPDAALPSSNKVLAEHLSTPLLDDIRVTNKTSQNLHAELALRLAGKLRGFGGSFEGGRAAVKQFLLQAGLK